MCKLSCCFSCTYCVRAAAKEGLSHVIVKQNQSQSLKYVNNVSCVDHLCSLKLVPNVRPVVPYLPVGARVNQFWETWAALGAGLKVIQILRDGYTLSFQTRPNLTKLPTIINCYVHPSRNLYLLEALHQLTNKITGQKSRISEVLQQTIFSPKAKQQMVTYSGSKQSQQFLKAEKFKMETP